MNKFFKYILAVAALAFAVTACNKEPEYEPGSADADGCYGVYFPSQEATGSHTFSPTETPEIEFIVKRNIPKGAIDVPYVVTASEEGIFELGTIHFNDGEEETVLKMSFANAVIGKSYSMSIAIRDELYASKYNAAAVSFDFSVLRVEWKYFLDPQTNEPAVIRYTEGWNGYERTGKIKYYEVDGVRTCVVEPDTLEEDGDVLEGFWGSGSDYQMGFTWYTKTMVPGPDGEMYEALAAPLQAVDYHTSYGAEVMWYDYYTYWTVLNPQDALKGVDFPTFASKYGKNYACSYYDGNGGFHFFTYYYYMPGIGGWKVDEYDTELLADGFIRVDYTLDAELDYSSEGVLPVYFELGADIEEVRFAGFKGELSKNGLEKAVEAIVNADEDSDLGIVTITKDDFFVNGDVIYAAAGISFEESGLYTIVAVGYDADGAVQNSTSVAGEYVTADDAEENEVVVSVGTEATSSRYAPEHTGRNSFGFFISGKDVIKARYAIIETSALDKEAASLMQALKDGKDEKKRVYTLTSSEIQALNAAGGYSQLATKLNALTSYTVLVWAANSNSEKYVSAEFTTEGLPNEIVEDGTFAFLYTVGYPAVIGSDEPLLQENMSLEYNPNTKQYEIPGWFDGEVSFKFNYDKEKNEITVPMQAIVNLGATYGNLFAVTPAGLPASWIDYFGIDTTQKSFVDENGVFNFCLSYGMTEGYYLGSGYEYFGSVENIGKILDEDAEAAAAPAAKSGVSKISCPAPGIVTIAYERDPKAVSVKVSDVAPKSRQSREARFSPEKMTRL